MQEWKSVRVEGGLEANVSTCQCLKNSKNFRVLLFFIFIRDFNEPGVNKIKFSSADSRMRRKNDI